MGYCPVVTYRSTAAEGWYRDPYGYPPPGPPEEIPEVDQFPADDLRRADVEEAGYGQYGPERVAEQASDAAATGYAGNEGW